jgi:hypothetical protein
MDLEQLAKELPALRAQLAEAETRAEAATANRAAAQEAESVAVAQRDALRTAVAGIEGLALAFAVPADYVPEAEPVRETEPSPPAEPQVAATDGPRGREAVRLVLEEAGRPMRPKEIVTAVMRRGWIEPEAKSPDSAIRLATRRLAKDGIAVEVNGAYVLKKDAPEPLVLSHPQPTRSDLL